MYTNQYQYEFGAIINTYHRDALRAEQLRIARTGRRGSIARVFSRIRTSIASPLIAAGGRTDQPPATHAGVI
jgi:hypothetical protein